MTSELTTSPLAGLVKRAYRVTRSGRRWRVGRVLIDAVLRLERGPFRSATARQLLEHFHGVRIGAYSYGPCFRPGVFPPNVTIGRYVSIGPDVRIYRANHPIDWPSTHPFFYDPRLKVVPHSLVEERPLDIGHDVWIGTRAIVLPGCGRIGIGAVIGAGAVVTRDVPDFAVVTGTPARVMRYRFSPDEQTAVLESKWWEQSIEQLERRLPWMTRAVEGPAGVVELCEMGVLN